MLPATALAHVVDPVIFAAPSVIALTLGRGVWRAVGDHGETVLWASTSGGRVLLDGPVILGPSAPAAPTCRLLWRMLNAVEPRVRIGHRLD